MLIEPSPSVDPPYPVYGGVFAEQAIALLRRFYEQENDKGESLGASFDSLLTMAAPEPRVKKRRDGPATEAV